MSKKDLSRYRAWRAAKKLLELDHPIREDIEDDLDAEEVFQGILDMAKATADFYGKRPVPVDSDEIARQVR